MARMCKIFMVIALALVLGACTVRTADDGTGSVSDGNSVGIENPFINGGEEDDDDDIIVSEGGSSGGSGSPSPAPATPQYDSLEITTNKLEACYQHKPYYQKPEGYGGSEHYEWTITGLPSGLELSYKRIVGTTTANPGNYTVTVTLKDTETEESITKQFSLKVIHFIVEDIKIKVSEMKGTTPLEVSASNNKVTSAMLYAEAFRLKLEVLRDDGSPASAPRFHWWFTSTDSGLGLVVPPAEKENENVKDGQVAYLMPWTRKGSLKQQALNIFKSEEGLQDIEVNVRDDFGNTATMTFDKIDIEETIFIKCNSLDENEKLQADIPASIQYSVDRLHGKSVEVNGETVIKDDFALTDVSAWGGVSPYSWKIGDVISDENAYYPQQVVGDISAETYIGCIPYLEDLCSKAQIQWGNIILNVPDINRMSAKLPVQVTDACGNSVYGETELKVLWPRDPLKDKLLNARISASLSCNTNSDTDLEIYLKSGSTTVAKAHYELDPIACDETFRYYDTTGSWGGAWMEINENVGSFDTLDIDRIEAHTSNPYIAADDDGPLSFYMAGLLLASKYWYRLWPDWSNPLYFNGAQGTDITGYFGGWEVRWEGVPASRRSF